MLGPLSPTEQTRNRCATSNWRRLATAGWPLAILSSLTGCLTDPFAGLPENAPNPSFSGTSGRGGAPGISGSGGTAGSATGGGVQEPTPTNLPCEVASLLSDHCLACHREEPPGRLLTRADLVATSHTDGSRSVAEEALARMQSTGRDHMPPPSFSPTTEADIVVFQAWVSQGSPSGGCNDPGPVPDPYDTPVVCTSLAYWTGGDRESPSMHPGRACIACHEDEGEGPTLAIAGTLYPTPHEPSECNGVAASSGAMIIIADANGTEHRLTPNSAGNFALEAERFALPYTARVAYQGRERIMVEPQTDGDCNGCHTEAGTSFAPGRIFLP